MCITNPSKISDFRENLLHMLLFWTLILFDSYAYSYKNRGCRMCNSPFYNLPFPASLLLLLLSLLLLFPLRLLDMQPIQHRPSATNAPWLFRHVVHAAIYHVVILLCAGFPRTLIRSVRQAFSCSVISCCFFSAR